MVDAPSVSSSLSREVVLGNSEGLSGSGMGSTASSESVHSVSMEPFGMVCSLGQETGVCSLMVSEDG